jgi:predicted SAM-dependent methyltransferase
MQKLIVGAGDRQKEGWTSHDVVALPGIQIVCEMMDLPNKVTPGEIEAIEATHVLEHFAMAKVPELFGMLYSLLKPGGEIYIEVPNFLWHAHQIIKNPYDRQIVEYAYGGQKDKWDYHMNGFTPQILKQDLEDVGFTVTELHNNSSIECRAKK